MNQIYRCLTLTGGLVVALAAYGRNDVSIAEPQLLHAAQPQPATSTTTMTVNGCDFTVAYTWSGFNGRQLIATFGLYERKGTLDASFDLMTAEGQLGKGGTVSHTFKLSANAGGARTIVARGSLVESRKYSQISGTSSASSPVSSTCG